MRPRASWAASRRSQPSKTSAASCGQKPRPWASGGTRSSEGTSMREANIRRKPPPCQVGFLTSAESVSSCRSAARGFDKAEWHDGTTHLLFTPVELLEKLAALTPRPRINLALYHGILAPRA